MLLSKGSIKGKRIITGSVPSSEREASYELRIDKLVDSEGRLVEEFLLKPQGIVKVVSTEIVTVPLNVMGFVFVKTKLCNDGVLALNIGIVDPGFSGPLQSALINFGKGAVRLRAGDVYSRIVFHDVDSNCHAAMGGALSHSDVLRNVVDQVDGALGGSFLNISETVDKAAGEMLSKAKNSAILWISTGAVFVTLLTFALNFMNMWAVGYQFKPQVEQLENKKMEEVMSRVVSLERKNSDLVQDLKLKESINKTAEKNSEMLSLALLRIEGLEKALSLPASGIMEKDIVRSK
ncbi:hypothetical protein HX823_29465 [Pseudomonas sp. P7759]|uniref:dCTP deaminase domain-containing protein n=1 Tax=Pseudomonas sp. P7759 TaxID=2738831 RepID=UPI0015A4CF7A|nr:hypothetical protein [Pseudomonas sp. P7759]NWC78218.1 hypothetical protein [Pseudomonas sp. P7759]